MNYTQTILDDLDRGFKVTIKDVVTGTVILLTPDFIEGTRTIWSVLWKVDGIRGVRMEMGRLRGALAASPYEYISGEPPK